VAGRAEFEGRSLFRTWLYRIATNLCLNVLERSPRRVLPYQVTSPAPDPRAPLPPSADDLRWLQPYPDGLLKGLADSDAQPDEAVVSKETIELAFIAAIQLLPPRQRAVLILRDVLGWSAKATASLLDATVASTNSALQRARAAVKEHLPDRHDWIASSNATEEERALLRKYIDAVERGDFDAFAVLLAEDARLAMPPFPAWYQGRDAIVTFLKGFTDPKTSLFGGHVRLVATRANMQPAIAFYVERGSEHLPMSLNVLSVRGDRVVEIVAFPPELFGAFGLPRSLR
jgi:RNA polymerase sigma-70 factor (ECF subfamily)